MAALPIRIKQNVRDHFTSADTPLNAATTKLEGVLGYPIFLDPEWAMLWKTLQEFFPDNSTFVPGIVSIVITWCEAFNSWLEDDKNQEQVDELLESMKSRARLEIVLEISEKSNRPTTAWRVDKAVFVIALPKTQLQRAHYILAGFAEDLLSLFTDPDNEPPKTATARINREVPEEIGDWATLDSPAIAPLRVVGLAKVEEYDSLPHISTLQRPEELTQKPPYWLVVRQEGRGRVVVEASHSPSLSCLEEYLRRWCRGNVNQVSRPPVVEIRVLESSFGLGLMNDTLTMEATRGREVNAMLVLVFVENVLGYSQVNTSVSGGAVWQFKRTRGFK
ncbi:hypothetical protein B0J14DRAFT_638516 [Halenospora varia]|nr:hypothetical protein B0J14DRAFT_638516 [Halenospora varia]